MKKIILFLLTLFLISSCGNQENSPTDSQTSSEQTKENPSSSVQIEAPQSPEKAISDFYSYLNAKKYREAYALWDDAGKASGYSFEEFQKGYSSVEKASYRITSEIYLKNNLWIVSAEIPVEVSLAKKNGEILRYTGTYIALQSETSSGNLDETPTWSIYTSQLKAKQ